ncbi:MAG: hypothetical protein ACLR7G_18835 [[Clostridium] symbiosum]
MMERNFQTRSGETGR